MQFYPKPYIDGMMTKKWLKTNEDFKEVTCRIENYRGLCKSMRAPSAQVSPVIYSEILSNGYRAPLLTQGLYSQVFVNEVHYYVAREYVSQLMKKKYSCKKTKSEDAAVKLREQWKELRKLFEDMVGPSLALNSLEMDFSCTDNVIPYTGIILKLALSVGRLP